MAVEINEGTFAYCERLAVRMALNSELLVPALRSAPRCPSRRGGSCGRWRTADPTYLPMT